MPPRETPSVPVVSVRLIPKEEVAYARYVFPAPPMRSDDDAIEDNPVPPRAAESVPVQLGEKVKVPPEFVIAMLRLVSDEVAKVMAPVCAEPPPF